MRQRAVRARKQMCVHLFLRRLWSGRSALSPSRLLAKLHARARRVRLAGAGGEHGADEAGVPTEAWAVTAAERAAVEAAWGAGSASQLLALDEDTGLQLTRRDLRTLRGSSWLNDEVVNFYLQLAVRRAAEAHGAARVHVYSSYFYEKLACGRDGYDYAAVRRWTKAVDIYTYDLLLVPVNHDNAHWTLAAVWPARRRIEHYCSLSGAAGRQVVVTLLRYMMQEASDKGSLAAPVFDDDEEEDDDHDGDEGVVGSPRWQGCRVRCGVPRQSDGSACGVFVAAMAARLAAGRGAPFGLSQADVPALRLRIAADCLARHAAPVI